MPKLLVMDKNIFQGTSRNRLIDFIESHRVILPHALIAECLMSKGQAADLLKRFVKCIKHGGEVGWGSPSIFQNEKQSHRPVISIINKDDTQKARQSYLCADKELLKKEAELCEGHYKRHIDWLGIISKAFFGNVKKDTLVRRFFDESPKKCQLERLKDYFDKVDTQRLEILNKFVPEMGKSPELDWVTWYLLRLQFVWGLEWTCKRTASGSSYEEFDISNDFWDIEYVVSLSRADGRLTNDGRLVLPLARAAFPEKDVFSCLEEVTEDYRC